VSRKPESGQLKTQKPEQHGTPTGGGEVRKSGPGDLVMGWEKSRPEAGEGYVLEEIIQKIVERGKYRM